MLVASRASKGGKVLALSATQKPATFKKDAACPGFPHNADTHSFRDVIQLCINYSLGLILKLLDKPLILWLAVA